MKRRKNRPYWIAWLWLLLCTPTICSAQRIGEPSWTVLEQGEYVSALEDSLIVLKAIRPAYVNLKIVTSLQNEQYQTAKRESVLEKQVCEMQIKRMQNEINAGRKKSFWKGFKVGSIIVIIVTTSLFLL